MYNSRLCYYKSLSVFMFLASFFLFLISMKFVEQKMSVFFEWEFLYFNSVKMVYLLFFDSMSLLFMSFVLLISASVVLYSSSYMEEDLVKSRFLWLIFLFVLSMLMLILSPNFISMLLGWDGLGLVSYCLVIYYQNPKSSSAGMLTVLTNRIGDVLILASIGLVLGMGSWNYMFNIFVPSCANLIILLFVLAAMTKSAQIPFSSWLPAAMAAPTPVSSLVHSSTLVTAGVYILIRFNNYISQNSLISSFLLFSGSMTMMMSGLSANLEFDVKKIIALSTLSQLGVMMSTLSIGLKDLAFFHLVMHALFKALLFMCAGEIIHSSLNNQDIRFLGNLTKILPVNTLFFNTANMALCGAPFLSGFFSKDLILEKVILTDMNFLSSIFFFFATGLTVSYTIRLMQISILSKVNSCQPVLNFDSNFSKMQLSMVLLFFFSVCLGAVCSILFLYPNNSIVLPVSLKLLVIFVCFLGGFISLSLSKMEFKKNYSKLFFFDFNSMMWFLPFFCTFYFKTFSFKLSSSLNKILVFGWIEVFFSWVTLSMTFSPFFYSEKVLWISKISIYIKTFILFFMLVFFLLAK